MTGSGALSAAEAEMLECIDASAELIVERAVRWCHINSGSDNLDGLHAMADALVSELAVFPGACERIALPELVEIDAEGCERRKPQGECLRLGVRPEAPIQIALTGHYDTVFSAGSAFQVVHSREDGTLNGPGIADMKGGISVMLAALVALEEHPASASIGYTVLLSPDEETGSLASAPLLADMARTAQLGMTYEPALADGTLVSARKGSGNFHLVAVGKAAHAGRDFATGRNALACCARIAGSLDRLNGRRDGVTLNIARIDGGGALNVVPDRAVLRFNVRVPDPLSARWVEEEVDRTLRDQGAEGVSLSLHGGFTRAPKPFTSDQQVLFERLHEVGALIGHDLHWAPSGGVCEGNNLYAHGVPNIDTLGVRGGAIHSEDEFAVPASFAERARLSALFLARLDHAFLGRLAQARASRA